MTALEKAIDLVQNALRNLERVRAQPADETSLLVAYGDLEAATRASRKAFADLGFCDPIGNLAASAR